MPLTFARKFGPQRVESQGGMAQLTKIGQVALTVFLRCATLAAQNQSPFPVTSVVNASTIASSSVIFELKNAEGLRFDNLSYLPE